ncbi:MAG TPA: hypothetical protein VKS79_14930 [Gemmataceae bacterium]|nr:hypothetical protein [Gemmataceae bacterium]
MKWLFALIASLAIGVASFMPTSAQAGPLIYRGGPYDRWVNTGYVYPNAWGYNYPYTWYNPYWGGGYYNGFYYSSPYYSGYYYGY